MPAVVITGGARGQGAAHAERFGRAGYHVFVADVLIEEARSVVARLGSEGARASYFHLDVTAEESWNELVATIASQGEQLQVLVNNAGVPQRGSRLVDLPTDEWDRIMGVNVTGAFLGIRTVAPAIRAAGGGSIINVGSSAALTGNPRAAYTASKWALRGLTKAAAFELADWGIRVNCIHPGIVPTPMTEDSGDGVEVMRLHTPLRRVATVAEIAEIVFFLASDAASYLTGIDLPIDGGFVDLGQFWSMIELARPT